MTERDVRPRARRRGQNESSDRSSLPARVASADHACFWTESLTKRTDPPPSRTFTPPGWAELGPSYACVYGQWRFGRYTSLTHATAALLGGRTNGTAVAM